MISNYEKQYMEILTDIYENGFADGTNERTKRGTKRLPGKIIQVDVKKEFPILKSKFVAAKTALREILWIWQAQSNHIQDLKAHIWDEWADENGSIGKAYGYQMNRPISIFTDPVHKTPESFRSYKNQAEYILEYLREFPNGRWGVATIWNPEELSGMNLVPCCHTTTWNLDGGRLNCLLDQRSGDMPYGVPFNTTQYAELMILFARDLGVKPGILTHVIADAHIYENQMDGVEEQIARYQILLEAEKEDAYNIQKAAERLGKRCYEKHGQIVSVSDLVEKANAAVQNSPCMEVNESAPVRFFEVKDSDVQFQNYEHMGKLDFGDVAV